MWPTSALVQVSMVHFSLVIGLFCKVLTQDPGTLDRADADPRFSCIADLVENNQSPHRFCPYCEVRHYSSGSHCFMHIQFSAFLSILKMYIHVLTPLQKVLDTPLLKSQLSQWISDVTINVIKYLQWKSLRSLEIIHTFSCKRLTGKLIF